MVITDGDGYIDKEKEMKKKWIMLASTIGIVFISAVLVGLLMSLVEKPVYEVIASQKNIEIRSYKPMIIAEVEIEGTRKDTISQGFRVVASYIFGNNTVKQNIAMTAPVQQQKSQKVAMTVPVQQQSTGQSWKVSFVMPAKYSIENLPKPNDNRVRLKKIPAKKFIAIKFSGTNSNKNIAKHEKQLMDYIKAHQVNIASPPKYAFYNPPWTLPCIRRNEVMVEIKEQQ